MTEYVVALCTAPDADVGARLARGLVEARLAACVNVIPGLRSIYRWKDAVQDDPEVQLLIKTRRDRIEAIAAFLKSNHPYEVPELIALPIVAGAEPYLAWLGAETVSSG